MRFLGRLLFVVLLIIVAGVVLSYFGEGVLIAAFLLWLLPLLVAIRMSTTSGRDAPIPLALFLGWIGVLIALTLDSGGKTCPECAEKIKEAANVCRFCGHRFPDSTDA